MEDWNYTAGFRDRARSSEKSDVSSSGRCYPFDSVYCSVKYRSKPSFKANGCNEGIY